MEFENENSTELEAQSGEQAGAVAPQDGREAESPDEGRESVVGSQNSDFALVDVGEDDGAGESAPDPDGAGREDERQSNKQRTGQRQPGIPGRGGTAPHPAQSRQENAAIRAARLRAQRDAETAAAARLDAEIASSGVVNPYTQEPFKNMQEFREYGQRVRQAELKRQSEASGRSVAELEEEAANRAFLTALRQQSAQGQRPQSAQEAAGMDVNEDAADFMAAHPEVNLAQLMGNQRFVRFCGSRLGQEPLTELYDAYTELVGEAGSAAVAKAAKRSARTTGSGTAGGVTLSPSQKAALDRWNEEHPEMAMTAREFLSR